MLLLVLCVAIAAVIVGYALLRRYARDLLRARGRRSDRTPASMSLDAEPFELARGGDTRADARADARLRGWLVRAGPGPRPTLLFAHGWHSHAGDMLLWAEPIVRAGFHAIIYDALGHGESDPVEFTSIRHLRDDLRAVTVWAQRHPLAAPGLFLFGHSMGGAVSILVAAEGAPVQGVIAAGAPTDAVEVAREYLESKGMPGALLLRLLLPFWRPIVAERAEALRPVRRIEDVAVPVLLLHGTEDRQVSAQHARELSLAHPRARLELFEGADHYSVPRDARYARVVREFVDRALREQALGAAG